MADITINGITVDPLAPAPAGLAPPPGLADAANTNYILVQPKAPLNAAQRNDLARAGAKILELVPDGTYVCHYAPDDLLPVQALPFVEWAGRYLPGFKLAASLTPAPVAGQRLSLAEAFAGPPPVLSDTPKTVNVVFHRDADLDSAVPKVAAAAGLDPTDMKAAGNKVQMVVELRRLHDLAALDEVRHVEEVYPAKLHNNTARLILGIDMPNPGAALPFEGDGQIVAVADTGFDKGSTVNVHPAFVGRVQNLYALGRPKSNDPHGHGTHVAGSVLGDGASTSLGVQIRGTAPQARLVLQSVLDSGGGLGGLPADLHDLFDTPYNADGARVHTNSWGSTRGDGRYNSQAFELDDFVWQHRDCVICFAAGNEGTDRDHDGQVDPTSVTPPGTAKNCITVGACENYRPNFSATYGSWWPSDFPVAPLATDPMADNPDGMVAFSSRGPAQNNRFKPDVVAPGTFVLSARSRDTSGSGWGLTSDSFYYYMGGTSMATPLVAGCAALVREYLITQRHLPTPSAALVKAMLVNGAQDIPGQYVPSEAGPIPNFSEGFGRVDMTATLGAGAAQIVELRDEGNSLDTGEEEVILVAVPAGATLLKATLVWTDPAGETLQNDLDLIVRAGGQERHGNVPAGSAAFDRVNNVEQVLWDNVPAGNAEVVVRAFRVTLLPQSFALVVRVA